VRISQWLGAAFAALAFILLAAMPAAAAEVIRSFTSNVVMQPDGSVDVTEIIEVNAEGNQIRRGIYRDIPTFMVNADNSRLRSSLAVREVRRNGNPEPYTVEALGGGFQRIRIGDADVSLDYSVHRYTIRYTMTRMARHFADHDELFWNATGNYWDFPIERSVTTITLPPGAVISELVGYTGRVGSTEQDVTITRTGDNTATITATRRLEAGEGISVAASFQKGIVPEPTGTAQALNWLSDHRDVVLPAIAVAIVLLYNFLAWSAVGRDPAKGTIIPLFHPPRGFSPALVHFVNKMGWDNNGWTAFTASIFDLGVKGLITIENVKKVLKVTATGKEPASPLPPGEQLLFSYFKQQGSVTVNTSSGPKLEAKRGEFVKALETENRQVYFNNNTSYVIIGIALSLLCLGALLLLDVIQPLYLILAVAAGVAVGLFTSVVRNFWKGNLASRFVFGVWVFIVAANLGTGAISWLSEVRLDTPLFAVVSIVAINVVFAILMRAPTVQGRKVMDQIDGLKMYLETAEEKRLNMQGEPPMTVERFEQILPYAIALKVEKPWSDHFEAELARNAVQGNESTAYSPGWYRGSDWSSSKGGFSNTVLAATSGMSAAMIAAQPASSSSSGFSGGGGGGSGGGGGGGGGGGW
jgi:uncharacterized membrane protein YgcG